MVKGPHRLRTPGVVVPDTLQGILIDLAGLNFVHADKGKRILGDCKNVEDARADEERLITKDTNIPSKKREVIEISSGSEISGDTTGPPAFAETKAKRIFKLTRLASQVTDSVVLSGLMRNFVAALKCNSSRTLTKEASSFLDTLCKQFEGASVFVVPARWVPIFPGLYYISVDIGIARRGSN